MVFAFGKPVKGDGGRRRPAVEEHASADRVDLELELAYEQPAEELADSGVEQARGPFLLLGGRHLEAHRRLADWVRGRRRSGSTFGSRHALSSPFCSCWTSVSCV